MLPTSYGKLGLSFICYGLTSFVMHSEYMESYNTNLLSDASDGVEALETAKSKKLKNTNALGKHREGREYPVCGDVHGGGQNLYRAKVLDDVLQCAA